MQELQSRLHSSYRIVAGEVFTRVNTDYLTASGKSISVFITHKSAQEIVVSDSGSAPAGDYFSWKKIPVDYRDRALAKFNITVVHDEVEEQVLVHKEKSATLAAKSVEEMIQCLVELNTLMEDADVFYHGTKADLKIGDELKPGFESNYYQGVIMNHIYFTAVAQGAGMAAEVLLADGEPRVYIVQAQGEFENDPNVTDKKFPGNPTRSYRSKFPLKIIGEVTDWKRLSPEELNTWRENIARIKANPNAVLIN